MVFNIERVHVKKELHRFFKKILNTIDGKMDNYSFLKAYQKGDIEMSQWENPGIGWEHTQ